MSYIKSAAGCSSRAGSSIFMLYYKYIIIIIAFLSLTFASIVLVMLVLLPIM